MTTANAETRGFETEVNQLLDLMIHSLYSNKDIFLRELISNASDACDRLRFSAISNGELYEDDIELKIRVSYDPEKRSITISDNGIGMSDEELAKLGEIYFRGERDEVIAYKGSGLGVPLAYGIIELVGGTVDVETEVDKGTTFTVRIKGMG